MTDFDKIHRRAKENGNYLVYGGDVGLFIIIYKDTHKEKYQFDRNEKQINFYILPLDK